MDTPSTQQPAVEDMYAGARRRKVLLVIGISLAIVVLLSGVIAVVLTLRTAGEQESTELEQAADKTPAVVTAPPAADVGRPPSDPPLVPGREPRESLAITLSYEQAETFDVAINSVQPTVATPTVSFLAPGPNQPHSIIQLRDANSGIVSQHRFTVQTFGLFENFANSQATVHAFGENTVDMIVPLPLGETVTSIRVITPEQEVLDEHALEATAISQRTTGNESLIAQLKGDVRATVARPVQAATTQEIVVVRMNDVSEDVQETVLAEVEQMLESVAPWSDYAGSLRAAAHATPATERDTGCTLTTVPGFGTFPNCPNTGQLMQWVLLAHPNVHSVVVVMNSPCACGSAWLNSRVSAIGTQQQQGLIAHELGHAIGGLADEYIGDLGLRGATGPNCYATESQCIQSIERFESIAAQADLSCQAGCHDVLSWRTSNLLMYNNLHGHRYGPVQQCIMHEMLGRQLGSVQPCPLLPNTSVLAPPAQADDATESHLPTPVVDDDEAALSPPTFDYYGTRRDVSHREDYAE